MARRHRRDANEKEIVAAFKKLGWQVIRNHSDILKGLPDLLIAKNGTSILVEVKMPEGRLDGDQKEFLRTYSGEWRVVSSVEECMDIRSRDACVRSWEWLLK